MEYLWNHTHILVKSRLFKIVYDILQLKQINEVFHTKNIRGFKHLFCLGVYNFFNKLLRYIFDINDGLPLKSMTKSYHWFKLLGNYIFL